MKNLFLHAITSLMVLLSGSCAVKKHDYYYVTVLPENPIVKDIRNCTTDYRYDTIVFHPDSGLADTIKFELGFSHSVYANPRRLFFTNKIYYGGGPNLWFDRDESAITINGKRHSLNEYRKGLDKVSLKGSEQQIVTKNFDDNVFDHIYDSIPDEHYNKVKYKMEKMKDMELPTIHFTLKHRP